MQDREPSLEYKNDVAVLTLRRVSQHNRIAPDDCAVISGHLREAAAHEGLCALVLTGEGDRTFSSGRKKPATSRKTFSSRISWTAVSKTCSTSWSDSPCPRSAS